MPACPACGEENPERARFCWSCGAALAAAPARKVRKIVTVVFSDVTGSTALGERLDPESLREVMSRYFEEARSVLERHGGTVEKFIGDAVMAVFGVPAVHEDDALRAVRAAAELRDTVGEMGLTVRIGVDTGEVVAGTAERLVTGDAVNVAARLEQAAAPGEVLIGAETRRLVRDAVTVEELEPLVLKGKAEPVPVFRLLEVAPGAPAHARRLDSPLVGRERERRRLEDSFEQAVADHACHLFTVLGAAGVGKSRLVAEVVAGLGPQATVITGRCLPYGDGITFWPVVEAIREIDELEAAMEGEADAAIVKERIAQLLGLTEAGGAPEETFWAVRKLFEALARRRPLVLVFDDCHWAEPTFLDLVEHVADWTRDAPILLVCLARPELLDARPQWGGGKLNATSVLLEPLSEDECERLIANLLGQGELAESARLRIGEAAEGNPLFVEEMLAMLIDDGLVRRENGGWAVTADLSSVSVPASIHALIAARIDRLDDAERRVIERAAVEGKVFHRGAVAALSPEDLAFDAPLATLVRKELIRPDRSSFPGDEAFRFRHILIRDAAYAGMPKDERAQLHERFGVWLEGATGESASEYEEIIGYHFEQAFRYREELGGVDEAGRRLAVLAAERLAAAGRRAVARGDMPAAANLLRRAASLSLRDATERPELLLSLGAALFQAGELVEADAVLDDAVEAARTAGDRLLEHHALIERAAVRAWIDPARLGPELSRAVELAIPVFESQGDHLGLARAFKWQADVYNAEGRGDERAWALERALHHAEAAGDAIEEGEILNYLPGAYSMSSMHVDEAIRRCAELLARPTSPLGRVMAMSCLGELHGMRGDFQQARRLLGEAEEIAEQFGLKLTLARIAQPAGWVFMLEGDYVQAERAIRRGCELFEAMGERGRLSTHVGHLAQALYAQGRFEEAEQWSRRGEELGASDDVATQMLWRQVRAKVFARRGEFGEGERLAREAVALVEGKDVLEWRATALVDLAEVLRLAGRGNEAVEALEEAVPLYEQKGNLVEAERTRALISELAPA